MLLTGDISATDLMQVTGLLKSRYDCISKNGVA